MDYVADYVAEHSMGIYLMPHVYRAGMRQLDTVAALEQCEDGKSTQGQGLIS